MKEGIVFTFCGSPSSHRRMVGGEEREGKGKTVEEGRMEGKGEREYSILTFLWFTIFIRRSSLNALFAYVSF